jgi:hypothetical protein
VIAIVVRIPDGNVELFLAARLAVGPHVRGPAIEPARVLPVDEKSELSICLLAAIL